MNRRGGETGSRILILCCCVRMQLRLQCGAGRYIASGTRSKLASHGSEGKKDGSRVLTVTGKVLCFMRSKFASPASHGSEGKKDTLGFAQLRGMYFVRGGWDERVRSDHQVNSVSHEMYRRGLSASIHHIVQMDWFHL